MSGLLLDWRRRWHLRRCPVGPLRDYYARPFPRPKTDYRDVEYVAVDLETTGLDAKHDQILSFGWVVLRGPKIELATARHQLVRVHGAIPAATAIIHQITDDQAATGQETAAALALFLADLAGRVMIAHHARIERGFIGMACRRLYGRGLLVQAIDTMALAQRTLERRQVAMKPGDLRLHALAERYHLPRYAAHNALADALSSAELFLAQAAHHDDGDGLPLVDFLS